MEVIYLRASNDEVIDALRQKVIIDDAALGIDKIPMTKEEREQLIKAEVLCNKL